MSRTTKVLLVLFGIVAVVFLIVIPIIILTSNRGQQAEATATLSSDQVLQTAQAIADATRAAQVPTNTHTLPPPTFTVQVDTATPANTPTPSSTYVVANYNSNVRSGPGEEYPIIDLFYAGDEADVEGRYDETELGTWWFIRRRGQGIDGWVWSGAVTLYGDEAGIPILEKPPLPTEPPEPTDEATPTPEETATETPTE
jgi:uncharacterized protein YgiM (DUF1202 family)